MASCSSEATESDRHLHEHDHHHHHHHHHHGHDDDDHHHHGHDHGDHEKPDDWEEPSLYSYIDFDLSRVLNTHVDDPRCVLKSPLEMMNRSKWIESDADEEIILHVQFSAVMRVKKICLLGSEENMCPKEMRVFINREDIDFDVVHDLTPLQNFQLPNDSRHAIDYKTNYVKFQNVQCITMFFPSNYGADTTKIYSIAFKGESTDYKRQIVEAVYESRPMLSDHQTESETTLSKMIQ